jgi:hypothetical protein
MKVVVRGHVSHHKRGFERAHPTISLQRGQRGTLNNLRGEGTAFTSMRVI